MTEDLEIQFLEGKKISISHNDHLIYADQHKEWGGDQRHPTPMSLFAASVGACSASVIKSFCDFRNISTEEFLFKQKIHIDDKSGLINKIEFNLSLPQSFPAKYRPALEKALNSCTVKKNLLAPPEIITLIN